MSDRALSRATFAGGCFWCMEHAFTTVAGVKQVVSGYSGGSSDNPTYQEVSAGKSGHAEAVEVVFDPEQVSYEQLLEIFWHNVDPTDGDGQFADRGDQYRTAIFVHDDSQRQAAEKSRRQLASEGRFPAPIVTEIVAASTFWPAEECHQNYACKNPPHYRRYHYGSGRGPFLEKVWGEKKC